MEEKKTWVATKDLVGTTFRVEDVKKRSYRKWNEATSKFDYEDRPSRGFSAFWSVETNVGTWSASGGQYSQILLAAENEGLSDVLGKTFSCASNGEKGKEVRYFFDLVTD